MACCCPLSAGRRLDLNTNADQLKFRLFDQAVNAPIDGRELSIDEAYVSSLLLDARSDRPYTLEEIRKALVSQKGRIPTARKVKRIIRSLRQTHGLPILSTRQPPYGFWWCQSIEEMREFVVEFRSQPMDELKTLSVMVKRNYPALAGQLKFEEV